MIIFTFFYIFCNIKKINALKNDFFRHWHCIGLADQLDLNKPNIINIGELPLVFWKDNKDQLITNINICKHMGSRLDNGIITKDGCLKCQYHGLEMGYKDRFGETMEHDGKIFWSFNPIEKKPFSIPFFNNKEYAHSYLTMDMDCSLLDSALNTVDIRHPEYVHNKLFGFGSKNPPLNIKEYKYKDGVGLSFDYTSNELMQKINDNVLMTNNFHMYVYPTFTWSKVSFNEKNLIIGVNFLPLSPQKTRWVITLCHNYYKSAVGKEFMKVAASKILDQDFQQMQNQAPSNKLKDAMLLQHVFPDEEVIISLREMFQKYKYLDLEDCLNIYNEFSK